MLLIRNANIKTMAGPDLKNGCLLLENGKIAAVGQTVDAPEALRLSMRRAACSRPAASRRTAISASTTRACAGRAWIIMRSSSR